jgi:hypothetical protein
MPAGKQDEPPDESRLIRAAEVQDEEDGVLDDAAEDEQVAPIRYDISSYGIDFDVKGLVTRLREDKVLIPHFQRSFVWTLPDASRFVESLLLGLPVPGIFLAKDPDTNKLLVIDGQQRLKSLHFFYDGYFNPEATQKTRRVFRLTNVQPRFANRTYAELDDRDRQTIDDSVLHATIVKQDYPADDDTSIYHVYERLNSGGRKLTPQEIRTAIYHGALIDTVRTLNEFAEWRQLFGTRSARLKDQEMILRFFAFFFEAQRYTRPMSEFLSTYAKRHRNAGGEYLERGEKIFHQTMVSLLTSVGAAAFRPERNFNAAVFDSVAVGMAKRLTRDPQPPREAIREAYESFIKDPEYVEAVSRSTADQTFVERRMSRATAAFARI